MIGTSELHSIAYDQVELAIREVLYDTTKKNIRDLITVISLNGPQLSSRDIDDIVDDCYAEYEESLL